MDQSYHAGSQLLTSSGSNPALADLYVAVQNSLDAPVPTNTVLLKQIVDEKARQESVREKRKRCEKRIDKEIQKAKCAAAEEDSIGVNIKRLEQQAEDENIEMDWESG